MIYIHNVILFILKKKGNFDTCYNMVNFEKPVTKIQTVLFHLYDAPKVVLGAVERKTWELLLDRYRVLVL